MISITILFVSFLIFFGVQGHLDMMKNVYENNKEREEYIKEMQQISKELRK